VPVTDEANIDYAVVRRYWDEAAAQAFSASYMAHEQGLPDDCVRYRFEKERATVDAWFASAREHESVLDLGCGAGTWPIHFASQFSRVVGVEQSEKMVEAARSRLAALANVEIINADVVAIDLDERFDCIFLGGLLMYLNRGDVVAVLRRLPALLKPGGRIVLRESTVRHGVEPKTGSYQVVYRSCAEYTTIIGEGRLALERVELNAGYAAMETAVAIVDALRTLPVLRSREPSIVGRPVWRALRAAGPLGFKIVPGLLERIGITWPHLQNHFFLVRDQDLGQRPGQMSDTDDSGDQR
jgi:SAM-dependent methyltransferase